MSAKTVEAVGLSMATIALCGLGCGAAVPPESPVAVARESHSIELLSGFHLNALLAKPRALANAKELHLLMGLPWASSFLVTPTRAGNEPVEVKSCDELLGTIVPATEPAAPATARDYRVFVGVKLQCEAALELSVAKEAKVSFLDQFALDERVPHLFPKWLAIIVSPDDEERVKGSKYESWFDFEPVVSARDVTPQRGEFNSRGASQLIELVGKGDFNGDGIEDLLVTSRDSLTEGSYRAVRMFSLTRRGNQERLELLRQF